MPLPLSFAFFREFYQMRYVFDLLHYYPFRLKYPTQKSECSDNSRLCFKAERSLCSMLSNIRGIADKLYQKEKVILHYG